MRVRRRLLSGPLLCGHSGSVAFVLGRGDGIGARNASNQSSPNIGSWHSFLGAGGCLVVLFPTVCSVLDRQHIALPAAALAASTERPCVRGMFAVTEADATEIRAVVEVRRVSPAIEDKVHARESARGIAGYDGVADRTTQGAAVAPRAAARVGQGARLPCQRYHGQAAGPSTAAGLLGSCR